MKTRKARKLYKIAHRLRVQEKPKVSEVQLGPKWTRQNNATYNRKYDKQTAVAVKRYQTEKEEMKTQAAWVMRCVKSHFEPFSSIDDIYISNGRVWYRGAAPAFLKFGLDELITHAISEFRKHGTYSEEHKIAKATLGLLLRKDENKRQIHTERRSTSTV